MNIHEDELSEKPTEREAPVVAGVVYPGAKRGRQRLGELWGADEGQVLVHLRAEGSCVGLLVAGGGLEARVSPVISVLRVDHLQRRQPRHEVELQGEEWVRCEKEGQVWEKGSGVGGRGRSEKEGQV